MANSTAGRVWICDTVGMLTDRPVKVRKFVMYPNTASDTVTFKYYEFGSATAKDTASGLAITSVSTNVMTPTVAGRFAAAYCAAGDAMSIVRTSSGNNIGNYYIVSKTDDAATLSYATMTDETTKIYDWKIYAGQIAATLTADSVALIQVELDFGEGMWFPSLACTAVTRVEAKTYIHLA